MAYSKENFLEILRSPKLFKKKKGEIVSYFKDETSSQEAQQQKVYALYSLLGDIIRRRRKSYFKDELLADPQRSDGFRITSCAVSAAEQEQIGSNIVMRLAECLFAWACWHYRNSNGTKTRFFLALEGCMRAGVEFPEEEKFVNFTRDELFKYQGRSGYQAVLYIEDLVNMTDQIMQTIGFLKDQFSNGSNTIDEQTLSECLKLYEDYSSEAQSKDNSHFFHEDKLVYDIELKFVEDILPKVKKYTNKQISFKKFNSSATKIIEAYETAKKSIPPSTRPVSTNPSIQIIPPPAQSQILNESELSVNSPQRQKQPSVVSSQIQKEAPAVKFLSPDVVLGDSSLKSNKKKQSEDVDNNSNISNHIKYSQLQSQFESEKAEWQQKYNDIVNKLTDKTAKFNDLSVVNKELASKNSQLTSQLDDVHDEYNDINGKYQDLLRKQKDQQKQPNNQFGIEDFNDNESQLEKYKEEIKKKDNQYRELQKQQENLLSKVNEMSQREEQRQKQLSQNSEQDNQNTQADKERILLLESTLQQQNEERIELSKKLKGLQQEKDKYEEENQQLKNQLKESQQMKQSTEDMKLKYSRQIDQLQKKIEDLNQMNQISQSGLQQEQEELEQKEQQLRQKEIIIAMELEKQREKFEDDIRKLTEESMRYKEQAEYAEKKIQEQQEELKRYEYNQENIQEEIEKYQQAAEQAREDLEKDKKQLEMVDAENVSLKNDLAQSRYLMSQSQMNSYNEQILQKQIALLESKNKKLIAENDSQRNSVNQEQLQLQQENAALKEQLKELQKTLAAREQQFIEDIQKQTSLREEIQTADMSSSVVTRPFEDERMSYQIRVKELNAKVAELSKENERIPGLEKNLVELQEIIDQTDGKSGNEEEVKRAKKGNNINNGGQINQSVERVNKDLTEEPMKSSQEMRRQSDEMPVYPQHLRNTKPIMTVNNFFSNSNLDRMNIPSGNNNFNYALTSKNFFNPSSTVAGSSYIGNGFQNTNKSVSRQDYSSPAMDVERGRKLPRSYAQVKEALAATIQQSKMLDEEIGSYQQRKQHSASSQGLRGNIRSSSRDSQLQADDENKSQNENDKRTSENNSQSQSGINNNSNMQYVSKYRDEALRRLYGPKEEVQSSTLASSGFYKFAPSSAPLRLSQLPMAKSATTSFFPRNKDVFAASINSFNPVQYKSPLRQQMQPEQQPYFLPINSPNNGALIKNKNEGISMINNNDISSNNPKILLLPSDDDSFEEDQQERLLHQTIKNRYIAEQEHQLLLNLGKQKADLIFPFKSPKQYYLNKAQLHVPTGRLINKDASLFAYLPQDQLNRFKRACLKWKFPLFDTDDIQIGQISSFQVLSNAYVLKLGLYIANKTSQEITSLSLEHISADSVEVVEDIHMDSMKILPNKQIKQELTISYIEVPFQVPITQLEYRSGIFSRQLQIAIPCLITKFIEFQDIEGIQEFIRLWKNIQISEILRSEAATLNSTIAKTPEDFHACFPSFICLNLQKAEEYKSGLDDYVLGGQLFFRQSNTMLLLKIKLKPANSISFKVGVLTSNTENRRIAEYFLQTLLFLFTV